MTRTGSGIIAKSFVIVGLYWKHCSTSVRNWQRYESKRSVGEPKIATVEERDIAGERVYKEFLAQQRLNGYDPDEVPYRDLPARNRLHWRVKAEKNNHKIVQGYPRL